MAEDMRREVVGDVFQGRGYEGERGGGCDFYLPVAPRDMAMNARTPWTMRMARTGLKGILDRDAGAVQIIRLRRKVRCCSESRRVACRDVVEIERTEEAEV